MTRAFGWLDIVRIGLVQTALGAVLVLTTSTLNRVMVVEYALPAAVPGLLVGLHHAAQMLRPRWGFASDRGGRRTPWIVGGMAVLAAGGLLAAVATAWMSSDRTAGLVLAAAAFVLIGIGIGAAGTNALILLAERVDDRRRAPAATVVWVMMIAGFILTAAFAGQVIEPFTPARLVVASAVVSLVAFAVATAAVGGIEKRTAPTVSKSRRSGDVPFARMLRTVWADPVARRFTVFIFVSMLSYSAQDLILEPFAGLAFGLSPGETTTLGGFQNGGVLAGMIVVGLIGHFSAGRPALLRGLMAAGCIGSAAALLLIARSPESHLPIDLLVVALGFANGTFAVAAIGTMMALAGTGPVESRGTRMGLWGAAQAIAFGLGGLVGTIAVDLVSTATGASIAAYQAVFAAEGVLFLASAALVLGLSGRRLPTADQVPSTAGRATG
jgi:BCD family chlorophyll transporter-like MFS transporter